MSADRASDATEFGPTHAVLVTPEANRALRVALGATLTMMLAEMRRIVLIGREGRPFTASELDMLVGRVWAVWERLDEACREALDAGLADLAAVRSLVEQADVRAALVTDALPLTLES